MPIETNRNVFITCSVAGFSWPPGRSPKTPRRLDEQIAKLTIDAAKAGGAVVHWSARNRVFRKSWSGINPANINAEDQPKITKREDQMKKYSIPKGWLFSAAAFVCMAGIQPSWAQSETVGPKNEITFVSWTGPYMRSQMLGFVRPFEKQNSVRVHVEHYDGGISNIRDQVESANVVWDVVDLTQADSLRACNEGLLEDLSGIGLPNGKDGTAPADDFVEGALNKCGVGVIQWSTAFGYSKSAFGESPPSTIADFFDTDTYPGPRAIRNDPTVIMEWALMADGVARDDVYATLETEDGVAQALSKMDPIKSDLQLWSAGLDPVRKLNSGEVVMASLWATTAVSAQDSEEADFQVVFDGRVLELDLFGIPKGSRYKEEAMEFIRFASSTEALANMVKHLPNGPTRQSSLALLSDDTLSKIPNSPAYADKLSIVSDAAWWADNHGRLEEAFQTWLKSGGLQGPSGTTR